MAADRARRAGVRMTLAEAERIVAHDERGLLDSSDPRIAAELGRAHREIQRALMWGADASIQTEFDSASSATDARRRRRAFVVGALALGFAIAALLGPILLFEL